MWRCDHGLWTARKTLGEVWSEIEDYYPDAYFSITIEKGGEVMYKEFKEDFPFSIKYDGEDRKRLTYIAVKHPQWKVMEEFASNPFLKTDYEILDANNWRRFIPIPWLWKKLRHDRTSFSCGYFTMVDFL